MYDNIRLLILDLDGTVRRCTVPGQPCPNDVGEQVLLPGAAEGVAAAVAAGVRIAFATNQAGVLYGHTTEDRVRAAITETAELLHAATGAHANVHVEACFNNHPFWRKPGPGMLLRAMVEAEAAPGETLMVGDRESDAFAAVAAGCRFMDAEAWRAAFLRNGAPDGV